MKRRIVLEVDDDLTTAEMIKIGGCEDAFGLTQYVCRDDGRRPFCATVMAKFGIILISDERIA